MENDSLPIVTNQCRTSFLRSNGRFVVFLVALNSIIAFVTKDCIVSFYSHDKEVTAVADHRGMQEQECCVCTPAPTPVSFTCPTEAGTISIGGGDTTVELEVFGESKVCTLTIEMVGGYIKPVARSYSGNDWEASAGDYSTLRFSCDSGFCTVDLPDISNEGDLVQFQMTSFDIPQYTRADVAARFFEQSTFGPTKADIDSVQPFDNLEVNFANWVKEQQTSVPMSSHREFFRKHLNARFEFASPLGTVTHPCQSGTRYRRFAFSSKDEEKILSIASVTVGAATKKSLAVDGSVRTIVDGPVRGERSATFPDGSYLICKRYGVADIIGGTVVLQHPTLGCVPVQFSSTLNGNPPVEFPGETFSGALVTIQQSEAEPIDSKYYANESPSVQEVIISQDLGDPTCSSIDELVIPVAPLFGLFNEEYWIHDARFEFLDNTVQDPIPDGGGDIVKTAQNTFNKKANPLCANVQRNFLNEEGCTLSSSPDTCVSGQKYNGGDNNQDDAFLIPINHDLIRAVYIASEETAYPYAINDLRIENDPVTPPPCRKGSTSRWVPLEQCSPPENSTLQKKTKRILARFLSRFSNKDENPYVLDITFPEDSNAECKEEDQLKKGFEVADKSGKCWLNTHPDHLNVYDFTVWTTNAHPGNSPSRNPIKEFAESGSTMLDFPSWHEMNRWQDNKRRFPLVGRLGDYMNYYDIPEQLRTPEFNEAIGYDGIGGLSPRLSQNDQNASMRLVCGSPNEIANDPTLGGSQGRGAFDANTRSFATTSNFEQQKRAVWTELALQGADQLRQRIAWALAQILVVSTIDITKGADLTEIFATYYDIFVRNAFGNYRDVLKEVSYSTLMAEMLTYYGSRSTAYVYETEENIEYADENYAREIMQLFSTGLYLLDVEGNQVLNDNGIPIRVYENDDIEEYARAWTGFEEQSPRGNFESSAYGNRIDPMKINEYYRDRFPKMGLNRQYIGDGVPLCSDLPSKHFLVMGATYRLLGKFPSPELQVDPTEWSTNSDYKPLSLQPNSDGLFFKLCGSSNSNNCKFEPKIVLDESVTCYGAECSVDTVRTVEVANGIFYEYIRPPCVHRAFFNNAKTVVKRDGRSRYAIADAMVASASVACCDGTTGNGTWNDEYWGERTLFSTAEERCSGQDLCSDQLQPICKDEDDEMVDASCHSNHYFWTSIPGTLRVKFDSSGKIAIVHAISSVPDSQVAKHVQEDSPTFFRVDWTGDYADITSSCASYTYCNAVTDGSCICDVSISDDQVYSDEDLQAGDLKAEDVLDTLKIGAFDPSIIDDSLVTESVGEISWYSDNINGMSASTVFRVVDKAGISRLRKNTLSMVTIVGTDISFRNPVHFPSLVDPEPRDAHQETDETLDQYLYHQNTPSFLAMRFVQRFGISNPSPRYIKAVATSFRTGSYIFSSDGSTISFGSKNYGDLAATFACILLDREARAFELDADPTQGSLKEPIIKLIGLMRSLEYRQYADKGFIEFSSSITSAIGQMAHEIPTVFSFFLSDYQPSGVISKSSLVSPESQVTSGPTIVGILNGLFSLIKYGLGSCFGGLGQKWGKQRNCRIGLNSNAGNLTFIPSSRNPSEVVDELATLLTAGRLSADSRQIVQRIFSQQQGNILAAYFSAQQVIVSSPEFHSTNLVRLSGESRPDPPTPPPPSNPYKALVFVLLSGGMDSYNLLVPHTCSETNPSGQTSFEQYIAERTSLALGEDERSRVIDATGQPCSQFAIHPDLPLVESLYRDEDLAFFANMGVLNAPSNKENYYSVTRTQLFAHNTMQLEAQQIDPYNGAPGSGVLGRMVDMLLSKGYAAKPITVNSASVATVGLPGNAIDPLFVSKKGVSEFNPRPNKETFDIGPLITRVNEDTEMHSGLFGETWSSRLQLALKDNEKIVNVISNSELTQSFDVGAYADEFKTVSSLIVAHEQRGTDRDVFFLDLGGWDHHKDMKIELSDHFQSLDFALTDFTMEMKEQNLWNSVTVVVTSDFARTLTANSGEGSDHAWGGNYFLTGGSVSGGKIHGRYPSDLTERGPYNLGRGRLIPDLSWESMLNSVAMHMGIETDDELDYCMPNRLNTGAKLFTEIEVFDATTN